jgi:hypothetical protein
LLLIAITGDKPVAPEEPVQYFVVAADGQKYGPAPIDTLNLWSAEGRITAETLLESVSTGLQLPASRILSHLAVPTPLVSTTEQASSAASAAPSQAIQIPMSAAPGDTIIHGRNADTPSTEAPAPSYVPLYGPSTSATSGAVTGSTIPLRPEQWTNTSGTNTDVPPKIASMKWNWGAFGLGWIWLCGMNRVLAGILLLIGFMLFGVILGAVVSAINHHVINSATWAVTGFTYAIGLVIQIYLGKNGNSIAWRYRKFDSVQHFIDVQTKWSMAGIIYYMCSLAYTAISLIGMSLLASILPH